MRETNESDDVIVRPIISGPNFLTRPVNVPR